MKHKLNFFVALLFLNSFLIISCNNKPKEVGLGTKIKNDQNPEDVNLSKKWLDFIAKNSGFKEFDKDKFDNLDFSNVLSNHLRIKNDPISTYVGVFGSNFNRIDFHLEVIKKDNEYLIAGKDKLNSNMRELKGEMKLKKILLSTENYITDSLYLALFDCIMREPGDKNGDGVFTGIFTLVFYIKNAEIHFFKSDSGDEPTYTNTFIGKWTRYNSVIQKQCIFSFHAAGLYEKLPFCDELYTIEENDDFSIIKDKYKQFGWTDYNPEKKDKTDWWKK